MAKLMKGETFKDALKLVHGKPRFQYPIHVEGKADEIRCRVVRVPLGVGIRYESYAEKPLHNLDFLSKRFLDFFQRHPEHTELDVGILVNGNFNDSYRWTRSSKGIPGEKLDKKTGRVAPALFEQQVHVILFDLPNIALPFTARKVLRGEACSHLLQCGVPCSVPAGTLCFNEDQVWEVYRDFRALGLEGAMAKTLDHHYARARTYDWMKIKPSADFDGRIVKFNEAISEGGTALGRVGSIDVVCEDGSTASPAGINHTLGRELWENQEKYLGQWIEFNCMERDRKGGYRHPIYQRFREDKV